VKLTSYRTSIAGYGVVTATESSILRAASARNIPILRAMLLRWRAAQAEKIAKGAKNRSQAL
jgi:hypothetical protein